jgi:hypothetical protein
MMGQIRLPEYHNLKYLAWVFSDSTPKRNPHQILVVAISDKVIEMIDSPSYFVIAVDAIINYCVAIFQTKITQSMMLCG